MEIEIQAEDKPYSCLQCDLFFKMTKDLKMHMIQHGGKKSHSCNLCGYSTTSASKLKRHMLVHRIQSCLAVRFPEVRNRKRTEGGPVHSGEKPVVCKQCNFSCTWAGSIKIHMLIHSGGKPYACTQCSYSCTEGDDLKKHLLAYSGEKLFVRTRCNFSCTRAFHLRFTTRYIQEKCLSVARNATSPALQLGTSRDTC